MSQVKNELFDFVFFRFQLTKARDCCNYDLFIMALKREFQGDCTYLNSASDCFLAKEIWAFLHIVDVQE